MNAFCAATLCGVMLVTARAAHAQSAIPIRVLPPASARSPEVVTNVLDLKHLPDGRVLVNVPDQKRLIVFDSSLARFTVLADSAGNGAIKYPPIFVPLIPFSADSTLFVDYDLRSFTVIDPNGKPGRIAAPPKAQDFLRLARRTPGGATATDAQGRLIYQVVSVQLPTGRDAAAAGRGGAATNLATTGANGVVRDSQVIVRADFTTRAVDTIATVKPQSNEILITNPIARGGRTLAAKRVVNPALPAVDDWAVLADGSIAIVRGGDYHIDWIYGDGTTASTPKMPFDWRRLTDEDKLRKVDSAKKIIDSLRASGVDPYMLTMRSETRTDTIHPVVEYATLDQMADYIAPIRAGAVKADADGNVWILPTTTSQARGGLLYDVVNRKGELFQRVQIPADRVIVGFGKGGVVYMVATTGNNRWHLERSGIAATH